MSAAFNDITVGTPQAAVGYFVDQKKGEVNELKQLLKNLNVERDTKRKREVIKKVIAYMTLGIDVSRLFTDMIMAIETRDIVIKKMVYLYLCNYAHAEPEMAIMCINSLRRDCDNEDPMVRGLALRSLCSLRMESILEYIEQPLLKSLTDISAYVRKTGAMGILKLHSLNADLVTNGGYLPQLRLMLQDVDATVVTNAIYVINELQAHCGGLEVSQSLVMALLNRIGEFSEWGLSTVLDIVARYRPSSEEETYAVMNLLDPVFRTANSGAVLATFKCFMRLTANMPELHPQIMERAKPSMLTLLTGAHGESQFCMLKHLETMLRLPAAKGIFDDEFRQFFVRYNEPAHVKHLKVALLPLIANEGNAAEIASELGEYVIDVDAELSKVAIRAVGDITMKIPAVSEELAQALLKMLMDMDASYVRAEAAIVLTNVVRMKPQLGQYVLPYLSKIIKRVEDAPARAALIWLLGEFGESVIEAPYLLEGIVNNYEEEQSGAVKLQLLTAAVKLFFKRPPEVQSMLGRLFARVMNETSNQDLHDKALLYYRLLSADVRAAEDVFTASSSCSNGSSTSSSGFSEHMDIEQRKKLFEEFNTLAIIYGMPSKQFIDEKFQMKYENSPLADFNMESSVSALGAVGVVTAVNNVPTAVAADGVVPTAAAVSTSAAVGSVNLLDWDDDVAVAPSTAAVFTTPATTAVVGSTSPPLVLTECAGSFTPQSFQQLWMQNQDAFAGAFCRCARMPASPADLEAALRAEKVVVLASGALPAGGPAGLKLFVYALEHGTAAAFLAQLIAYSDAGEFHATVKTTSSSAAATEMFKDTLLRSLQSYSPQLL